MIGDEARSVSKVDQSGNLLKEDELFHIDDAPLLSGLKGRRRMGSQ